MSLQATAPDDTLNLSKAFFGTCTLSRSSSVCAQTTKSRYSSVPHTPSAPPSSATDLEYNAFFHEVPMDRIGEGFGNDNPRRRCLGLLAAFRLPLLQYRPQQPRCFAFLNDSQPSEQKAPPCDRSTPSGTPAHTGITHWRKCLIPLQPPREKSATMHPRPAAPPPSAPAAVPAPFLVNTHSSASPPPQPPCSCPAALFTHARVQTKTTVCALSGCIARRWPPRRYFIFKLRARR